MDDYISREALLKCQFEFYSHGTHCYEKAVYADVIKSFPAADVIPVVHGEWIIHKYPSGRTAYICNRCRRYEENLTWTNYCPHCGAKMDGGDHDV